MELIVKNKVEKVVKKKQPTDMQLLIAEKLGKHIFGENYQPGQFKKDSNSSLTTKVL